MAPPFTPRPLLFYTDSETRENSEPNFIENLIKILSKSFSFRFFMRGYSTMLITNMNLVLVKNRWVERGTRLLGVLTKLNRLANEVWEKVPLG
ncbi:hypothetical protein BpHYR1_017439 [Brachionus plicatilis]|uniref:Uncharacterized protein n=1 Tax=Brachionus plicatilis TaxID=10195 RepID=A0A3M7R311_BRAPC|nr:hypothetical protein BpHYR1_017439 [Brachionus plicatilis]